MKKIAFLIGLILLVFLLVNFVRADAIPPHGSVRLTFSGENVSKAYAAVLVCRETSIISAEGYLNISIYDSSKNCSWNPIDKAVLCKNSYCRLYGNLPYSKSFRLAIYLEDINQTFITQELRANTGFNEYDVDLSAITSEDVLTGMPLVKVKTKSEVDGAMAFLIAFISALIFTIGLEVLTALAYVSIAKKPKKLLLSVFYANLISVPVVWILFYVSFQMPELFFSILIFAELFAVVFEAFFIHWLNKKKIKLSSSFVLSVLMNFVSLILGSILVFFVLFLCFGV